MSTEVLKGAYDRKVVCCGNVLEVYEYKEPIKTGYKNKIEKKPREQTLEVKLENFHRSIKRTKTKRHEHEENDDGAGGSADVSGRG